MNSDVAKARSGLHFEKLLLDVLNELKERDARVDMMDDIFGMLDK